ncbi:MAG: EscU/YscU/HrcU family type III secretion system export apparatus switch protein, partial [Treponemataceae bacterium]|nr:EscU/YscU/HrcU family type III secretion system export apparatus switch protein [Treponemataceae bacterium]
AVKYDSQIHQAPMVTAKGADEMARKIKELAKENNVEIMENKLLARELFAKVKIGDIIPEEYYQAMSIIFAKVYSIKGKR